MKKRIPAALLILLCLTLLNACIGPDEDALAQIGGQDGPTAVLVSKTANE